MCSSNVVTQFLGSCYLINYIPLRKLFFMEKTSFLGGEEFY